MLDRPSLLAHTIYQALAFDAAVRDSGFSLEQTLSPPANGEEWDGVSEVILGNPGWFEEWVEGEKECKPFLDGA